MTEPTPSKINLHALRERAEAKEAAECDCRSRRPRIPGHSDYGLGHDVCGCVGDSGVYTIECDLHAPFSQEDVLALIDAVEAAQRKYAEMSNSGRYWPNDDALRDALARFDFEPTP